MRLPWLMAMSLLAVQPSAPQKDRTAETAAALMECQAQVLQVQAKFTRSELGDAAWAKKRFEAANPGKTLSADWVVVDAEKPKTEP